MTTAPTVSENHAVAAARAAKIQRMIAWSDSSVSGGEDQQDESHEQKPPAHRDPLGRLVREGRRTDDLRGRLVD